MYKMFKDKKYLFSLFAMIVLVIGSMVIYNTRADNDNISVNDNATLIINNSNEKEDVASFGGSTSDDWNVGGNLAVTGTTAITGALTGSGALTIGGETNLDRLHQGGTVTDATSTMEVAFTLTAAQICDSSVITVNSGCSAGTLACSVAASLDITFPATSTLFADCLDDDGDSTEFIFYNSSPTAASTTQIVAGTGGFLYEPDGQDVLIGGSNAVKIKIQRVDAFESNEDYMIFVDEHIAG